MKSWMLREVKSSAPNSTASKWQSPDTDVRMLDSEVLALSLFSGNTLPSTCPIGGINWLELPRRYNLQTGFPSTKMFSSTMDGLADRVPFLCFIVCTLYGPAVPVLCLTCLLGLQIPAVILAEFPMVTVSLSFPVPLSLLILSSLFKPAWSNFQDIQLAKCTEGTASIIN